MNYPKSKTLSKSRIMRGLQCEKSLYLTVFKPELEAKADAATQARFDEGNKIGVFAQKKFPDGVLIDAEYWDTDKSIYLTQEAIKAGKNTLFEATFKFENFTARIDILTRKNANSPWHVIEVKSSTKVKDEHITDVAIQSWVLRNAGFKADKFSLMHIDNACIAPDLDKLFNIENITKPVELAIYNIEKTITPLKQIIENAIEPKKEIGPHCYSPYECPFVSECWKHIPTPSVFDIPAIGQRAWEFYSKGIFEIDKLKLSDFKNKQQKAVEVLQTKKRWVDVQNIKTSLKEWEYPLYFLDFETIGSALPLYDGTSPYQQVPFQFSCHILTTDNKLTHFEYLHKDSSDPRDEFAKALVNGVGEKGSIVAYNKAFEAGVMRDLADDFPKYSKALEDFASRLVDPLPIFRNSVYDPAFLGSFGIKSVAPAIIGEKLSYKNLEVQHGEQAQQAFMKMAFGTLKQEEKEKLYHSLVAYCRQDTLAMVELVQWLSKIN
ncbi:MAG: DUF2779 domain-containing protein [Oligoflexia bacterium]|nr:DUF2779 domain-containing protein [Oligoflexia bacterium]